MKTIETKLAYKHMRAHHQDWIDVAYKDFYMLDNGDNIFYYEHVKRIFVRRLVEDMGFNDYEAVQIVVNYFNKEVSKW